ncbi:alpha/beta hydrolase family protein [Paenibacillus contaminans]|uniref:Acetyl xylan esterase domain-containing protein n=1 Tax=Paenibacillus contaminans TaxID=450362 RepID=A0A329LJ88_9BACL|nr:acetylxylan esterase [Paenibacillus contaminans]RAV08305.1 hypothetical protein DQG23_41260 [Paenibacillus contaminans]
MKRNYSKQEQLAMKRRENSYLDVYPEIERYHQNPLLSYLDRRNLQYVLERKTRVKTIDTPEKAQRYIDEVRAGFKECLGLVPGSPNVRAVVTGTVDKGAYLIDCVSIESDTGVLIPANFYYPKGKAERLPAVLMLCGHAPEGKASVTYVSFCVEAVLNGFCVLTFDPIGQGERKIADPENGRGWLDAVDAHCLADRRLSLLGEHAARYMMSDNIKALDYLLTRIEADAERIAVTGNSGGGNMSAYMGAFDERIKAVAPSCYITGFRPMLGKILAQDAEQCVPGIMEKGLDISDLITAAAPKPYMIGSALFDFFPIEGTRDSYIEARKMYALLGAEENLDIYVSLRGHGFWFDTRAKVLSFFCRHFGVDFAEDKAIDYEALPTESELFSNQNDAFERRRASYGILDYVRDQAAIRTSGAGLSSRHSDMPKRDKVLAALRISADELQAQIIASQAAEWPLAHVSAAAGPPGDEKPISQAAGLTGRAEGESLESQATAAGPSHAAGAPESSEGEPPFPQHLKAKLLTFQAEPGMPVYGTLLETGKSDNSAVLVHIGEWGEDSGKLLETGYAAILCVEPRGTGRGKPDPRSSFGMFDVETAIGYHVRMLGQTLQGMRVLDAIAAVRIMQAYPGIQNRPIAIYGKEEHALTALYTAVIEGIHEVRAKNMLGSFRYFLENDSEKWGPSIFLSDLFRHFDVEELVRTLPPGSVRIDGMVDHLKRQISGNDHEGRGSV